MLYAPALLLSTAACGGAFGGSVFGDASHGGGSGGTPAPGPGPDVTRTVVATITTVFGHGTIYSFQPKLFQANGLYWLLYTISNNHVYKTSADGVTWGSQATALAPFAETEGHRIAFYHDGTYLHLVYGAGITGEGTVYYRRGATDSDGVITWSTILQTVFNDAGKGGAYVTVWTDSNGYPWIGTMYYSDPAYGTPKIAKVYKSSTTDGTWVTDTGFPKTLYTSTTDVHTVPICVPLTGGKVYCGWCQETIDDAPYRGQRWDGDSWDAAEDMTTSFGAYSRFTLGAEGDAVHLAFHDSVNDKVKYRKRSAAGAWGSEIELGTIAHVNNDNPPVIRVTGTDAARVHWETNDVIYYRDVLSSAASGAVVELRDETAVGIVTQWPLQVVSPLSNTSSYLLSYSVGTDPYQVISLLVEE